MARGEVKVTRLPDKDTVFRGLRLLDQRPMPLVLKSNGTRLVPGVVLVGKFKDITGGGDFQMRSDVMEYATKIQEDSVETAAVGVAE